MKDLRVDPDLIRSALERLVAVPSIAFEGFPRAPLDEAAAIVESLLREAGAASIRSVDVPGTVDDMDVGGRRSLEQA